jgi:hypothetical protein
MGPLGTTQRSKSQILSPASTACHALLEGKVEIRSKGLHGDGQGRLKPVY